MFDIFVIDQVYEKLPELLQDKVRRQIRERKGLKEEAVMSKSYVGIV